RARTVMYPLSLHDALPISGVRTCWVQFREHCGPCALTSFEGCTHAGGTSANNHDVVLMYLHQMKSSFLVLCASGAYWLKQKLGELSIKLPAASVMHDSKVKITRVPSTTMATLARYRASLKPTRVRSLRV